MTRPEAGKTHDIVIYVNDSVACGLTIRPQSLRVDHLPDFLPRLSQGDPVGTDTTKWKSFVQQAFFQGAGQYFWSSAHANASFAESRLWDIARPVTVDDVVLRYDPSWAYGSNFAPTGQLQVAVMPKAMTAGDLHAKLFSADLPITILEVSNNPLILHSVKALTYTAHAGGLTWSQGLNSPAAGGNTGKWSNVAALSNSLSAHVVNAVNFSTVVVFTDGNEDMKIWGPEGVYKPIYSTKAHQLYVYDAKIWRSYKGQVAYLEPADFTSPWSAYFTPFDVDININKMREFGGRLYFGTEGGLGVFDAGQVYPVQSFMQSRNANNFKLMEDHYGALYFNIRGRLYRYTGAGTFELIRTPIFTNDIVSGTSLENELIFMVAGAGAYQVWIYNADSGGTYMWFDQLRQLDVNQQLAMANAPNTIKAIRGRLFIAPMYLTGSVQPGDITITPIMTANRVPSSDARSIAGATMVTSSFDLGLPALDKQYNRIVVDHRMDAGSFIDVDVSVSPRQLPRMAGAATAEDIAAVEHSTVGFYDVPRTLQGGQFNAFFLPQAVQNVTLKGVPTVAPSVLSMQIQAQYTRVQGWRDVPDNNIGGDRSSYDVLLGMQSLSDWVADQYVPQSTARFYGMRYRYVPLVPVDKTFRLSAATTTFGDFKTLFRIDGHVVIDDGRLKVSE